MVASLTTQFSELRSSSNPRAELFKNLGGPSALSAFGASAARALELREFPRRSLEDWKYLGLGFLDELKLVLARAPLASQTPKISIAERYEADDTCAELTFFNGYFVPSLSRLQEASGTGALEILIVGKTAAANDGPREFSSESFASFAQSFPQNRFTIGPYFDAINASLAGEALAIVFRPEFSSAKAVLITCIASSEAGSCVVSCPRFFIKFCKGAVGSVIERHITLGSGSTLTTPSTDIVLESGARASFSRLQAEGPEALHFGAMRATVGRDASFECFHSSIGAKISRQETAIHLVGSGAEAVADGLSLAKSKQHLENRVSIEHAQPHTKSSQLYKAILADESRVVFNGKVRIERGAQKSNASQLCRNLSLSRKAEVDAKPELEIYADDVKASHGATVGQLDPEQLFYFQARAIDPAAAAQALSRGFAEDVILRRTAPAVRRIAGLDATLGFAGLKATLK